VSTRHVGYFWPIVPVPGECEDGEFGGMKTGSGNRSTRRKPAPAPLCPPQIPLDQTRARTRAAAVGNQRLTATQFRNLDLYSCDSPDNDLGKVETCSATPVRNKQMFLR
jgi:hypothetical protein